MGLLRASTRLREIDRMWQLFVSFSMLTSKAALRRTADKQGSLAMAQYLSSKLQEVPAQDVLLALHNVPQVIIGHS